MRREHFEHVIAAAATVVGEDEFVRTRRRAARLLDVRSMLTSVGDLPIGAARQRHLQRTLGTLRVR